jgi:ATP-dependent Lon protease
LPELTPEEIAKAAEASKTAQATTGDVLKHWSKQ